MYRLTSTVPVVLANQLKTLAKELGISRSDLIRRLLELGLIAEKNVWQLDKTRDDPDPLCTVLDFSLTGPMGRQIDRLIQYSAQQRHCILWRLLDVGLAQYRLEGILPDSYDARYTYEDL